MKKQNSSSNYQPFKWVEDQPLLPAVQITHTLYIIIPETVEILPGEHPGKLK
jgi:hypothetical protein